MSSWQQSMDHKVAHCTTSHSSTQIALSRNCFLQHHHVEYYEGTK